jgi:hypothetical protein
LVIENQLESSYLATNWYTPVYNLPGVFIDFTKTSIGEIHPNKSKSLQDCIYPSFNCFVMLIYLIGFSPSVKYTIVSLQ